jgi:ubiquinone/menaquinone biosynthesis C-methylase UbiE
MMTEQPSNEFHREHVHHHAEHLDSEERIRALKPEKLIEISGIKAGMTGVDLGCGTGAFALPIMSVLGPAGKLYCIDLSPEAIERFRSKNLPANMDVMVGDAAATKLPGGIADFVLMALLLHEVDRPDKVLAEAYRLLKVGGKALVMEWREDDEHGGPPKNLRIGRQQMERLLRDAGFSGLEYNAYRVAQYAAWGFKKSV